MLWIILLFIALQPLYKYKIEDIILRAILFYMVLSIHEGKQEGFQSAYDLSFFGINTNMVSLPTNISLPSTDSLISSTDSLISSASKIISDVSSPLSESSVNISALSPTGATGGIMNYIDTQVSSIVPTGATGPTPSSRYNAIPDAIPLTGATGPTTTYVATGATGPTMRSTYVAPAPTTTYVAPAPTTTYMTTAPTAVPLTPPTGLSAEVITTLIIGSTLTIGVIMITLIN